ncbi:MAG: hypothetical protein IKS41_01390 [Alphaproteobacteria bacterium]|nr:hypothetical protein [Alphaproteobacteria bacterium]
MGTQNQSFRSAFIEEQKTHVDTVMEEAQRLVNLYRHADAFGEEFMPKLDQMLLSASPEVQTALSDILGGQIVRQYCTYLKERTMPRETQPSDSDDNKPVEPQKGYLPTPDGDLNQFLGGQGNSEGGMEALLKQFLTAHQQELNEILKAQSENLTTVLGKMDQNTHEGTSHQTDRLVNIIQQETGKQKKYEDVIEAGPQSPVLVPDETEGF